jgi:hypothetical protein
VPDLTREDFEIRDSGRPAEATVFSREIQPITVVVMFDLSGSMRGRCQVHNDWSALVGGY